MTNNSHTAHTCRAIVVHCMDFRLTQFLNKWVESSLSEGFDRLAIAGGVKNLPFVLDQIKLSKKLHGIKEVYLINHEDCGAYGQSGNYEKHRSDLNKAKKIINGKYPDLAVFLLFLKLDGSFTWVY